ncbi:MAG: hypothetical protein ACU84H_12125 [Gammaproteobacteria bacterium]
MKKFLILIVALFTLTGLAGCAGMSDTQQRTVTGGLGGAAAPQLVLWQVMRAWGPPSVQLLVRSAAFYTVNIRNPNNGPIIKAVGMLNTKLIWITGISKPRKAS